MNPANLPAIVYLLWPKNTHVLERYLRENGPRAILTPSFHLCDGLKKIAAEHGSTLLVIDDFVSLPRRQSLLQTAHDLSEKLLRYAANPLRDEHRETSPALANSLAPDAFLLACTIAALDELASEYAVELVVLNEDVMPLSKAVWLWSKKHGIPSIHLYHNPGVQRPYAVHTERNADIVALDGEATREEFIDAGFDPGRLAVTGLPHLDRLAEQAGRQAHWRAEICRWHGIDPARPIVVYGTTWTADLSHLEKPGHAREVLKHYFQAIKRLGSQVQHVIKDRPATGAEGETLVRSVGRELGVPPTAYSYVAEPPIKASLLTSEKPLPYLLGADLVVAADSGLLLEAMSVGTRALNIATDNIFVYGPSYAGDWGIRQCGADELPEAILATLEDERCLPEMRAALPRVNAAWDGKATERFVALMRRTALAAPRRIPYLPDSAPRRQRARPVWQTHLSVEEIDATGYHGGARKDLVEMSPRPIRCALDIGCAAGGTGAYIKEKYPKARVIGIELNRSAAKIAETRLDTVLVGKFEEIDFAAAGIRAGDIDTVIVADVLEHMYDPWAVLSRLQRYLSSDGQIIASIPNVRNLKLMEDLAAGYWRYEAAGLLDVTHIRFFTLREVRRFFHETGYHIRSLRYGIDARLLEFHRFHSAQRNQATLDVQFGRMSLAGVTPEELNELCSLQFYVVAQTGALADDMELYAQTDPYARYVAQSRPALHDGALWERHLAGWPALPKIEILLFDTRGDIETIAATIGNLANQLYSNTTLTVLSDTPAPEGFSSSERLRWPSRQAGESLLGAANRALADSRADWIGRLFPGDKLENDALLRLMELAHRRPDARCLYTDDDTLLPDSVSQPHLKPDFDPDLLLGWCYLEGLTLFERATLDRLGGFDESLRGAEIHDLALRLYEDGGLPVFAHLAASACHRPPGGNDNDLPGGTLVAARQKAVQAHLDRSGQTAKIASGWQLGSLRVERTLPSWPRTSILLPVTADLPLVQQTIEGIFEKTDYADFELLVLDNAVPDAALRAYLEGLDRLGDARLKVFALPEAQGTAYTPPALFNLLAGQADGEVLVCLDAGCSPLAANWLQSLVAEVWRPEIGAAAPRLLNGRGEIVRSALIAGCGETASDAFAGRMLADPGPDGRAHQIQRFSALPFGCLALRSEVYRAAQGFDADEVGPDLAALDLTLRISAAGLACLWTPYVSLLCQTAADAGTPPEPAAPRGDDGRDTLYRRHLPLLARDPAYHPALSMTAPPFQFEARHPLFRDTLPWRPLPKILATHGDSSGCGHYRIMLPAGALNRANRATVEFSQGLYGVPELARIAPDAIVLQRQLSDPQIERMAAIRRHFAFPVHYELDDLITDIPKHSPHRGEMPQDTAERLRRSLGLVDTFIVSTEALKDAYAGYHGRIRVLPNRLSRDCWQDLAPPRRTHRRPRVGWSGSVSHTGDLLIVADVVQRLAGEVDWVFMGHCPSPLRPYIAEYHHGVPFDEYPEALAALDLDLAIAPLEHNRFNECKSNLKLLEYGVLGYPVIATDIAPYRGDLPVTLVGNKPAQWIGAIREHLAERDELARRGAALRRAVDSGWMLDDHLDDWLAAWTSS